MANADIVILQAKGWPPGGGSFHWTWTGSTGFFRQPRQYFPGNVVALTRAEADLNLANPAVGNPWVEIVDYNVVALPPPFTGSANGLGPGMGIPRMDAAEAPPPPVEPPPEGA